MKTPGLVAELLPLLTVMSTGPLGTAGTTQVSVSESTTITLDAATPPKVTVGVGPTSNPEPFTVTAVEPVSGPAMGVTRDAVMGVERTVAITTLAKLVGCHRAPK